VVAIAVIGIFTVGLPAVFAFQLIKRRHRLDEAKLVVRRRYQGWRKRLRQRIANRRVALLRGEEVEPLVDPEEEAMTNKDILAVYQMYYGYVREWDQLLFLHRDFRLARFYWELMEVIRKLLLVSVVVIVGNWYPGYDLVFGIVVLFCYFALHVYALPYKRSKHNFLKAAEMFAEYMTLFITMLILLANVTPGMEAGSMGQLMLGLQGLLYGGMVCVVIINLREGISDLKKQKAQEEGLGVVARVDQVSIYSVFFAVKLIAGLMRRSEAKRLAEEDRSVKATKSKSQKEGDFSALFVQRWEDLARKRLAGEGDGEEMLLQHGLCVVRVSRPMWGLWRCSSLYLLPPFCPYLPLLLAPTLLPFLPWQIC
jgi:hypothetical protein